MQTTLAKLTDQVLADLPRWVQRLARRKLDCCYTQDKLAMYVASRCDWCKPQLYAVEHDPFNAPLQVDPENLSEILEAILAFIEKLLPIIMQIIDLFS